MRALRVDKLTYAALEATVIEHLAGRATRTVPVASMIHATVADIETRARRVADRLAAAAGQCGSTSRAASRRSAAGSAPGSRLATRLLVVPSMA